MSADDFQTKYASVMESMLKSAVAETTKLFETMVDELKAEISRIKKENEDLKTRCSQFEHERSQTTVYMRQSEARAGISAETRDTAVQCDLVPFRTILVEQCQPLRPSTLQNQKQQCSYEEMEYVLQEHNHDSHGEGNSQLAFILVKQEQEEAESIVVCKQVLSHKADSPSASVCGIENEGPFINKVCSTRKIPSPQRHEETQVAQELPFLATFSDLQGAQNQSSDIEDSLVISLAAIKDDLEDESEVSQKITEIGAHGEIMTSEKHQLVVASPQLEVEPLEKEQPSVVSQECQTEAETSVNEKTGVTLQQYVDVQSTQEQFPQPTPFNKGEACDELKKGLAENEASSQPDLLVRRRRGRPPKKAKPLQQPVKGIRQLPSDIVIGREVKKSTTIRVEEAEVSSAVDTVNITSSGAPHACPIQPKESSSIITPSIQERVNTALEVAENGKGGSQAVSVASLSRRCSSEREKPSESQQLSMDMKEAATQAPSTKVCSAIQTLNSPPAASPQALSVQPRERLSSVTLQDAILLVEAMNQSGVEDTSSSPQRMASPLQTQCARHVGALQTVDKVPAEPQTLPLPVETHEAVDSLPITALPQTIDATPTNAAQAHIKVVKQKQQCTTTPSVPPSTTAKSVQSLLQHRPHTLITSVAPIRRGNAALHKIIVVPRSLSSLMPHKIATQSLTQILPAMSTVVAVQNNSILPGSTAAGLPLKTLSLSSVPQSAVYVRSSKSLPVVTQSTTTSTDVRSGTLLLPKKTIIIPRQMPAIAPRKHQSQNIVLTAQQESTQSAAPVMVSSSQELSSSVGTQTALGEVATEFSQKRDNTPDNLESPKQTPSVSETNAHTETCSSLNMSAGPVPNSESLAEPLTFEQNLSAVIRLTRLPFQMSTKESVLVSRLPTNGYSDSQSILKEGTTQEKSSSVVISTQPSETLVLSTDVCPSLTETSVDVSVNASQMPEEQNDIQEKASLSSENCTTLEESPNSGYVQPSAPSKVLQPVFEKSTMAINRTKPLSVSGTAGEPTSSLDEEINHIAEQDYTLTNGQPIEEKQSAALIHLTSITCKDTSDPHLQMTKTQFLAQLAVSPVPQDPEKASSNDCGDARASCAGTSTSDKKDSLMAQLRSHIKTHLKVRRTKTNPETETCAVSPKKPRLENDHPNDNNTTSEPIPLSPKNPRTAENVTSLKRTTNDPTPISNRTSQQCKDDVKPKRTVKESFSVSSRRPKATSEFTPVSARRSSSGRDDVGSKNRKSTSVSPRQSSSTKESITPKNTRNTSVRPRRISSTRDGASPNHTKTTSVRRKSTSMSRESASPKKTKSTPVSPRISGLRKDGTNPKISTNESTSVSSRRCTVTKDDSSTKQIKRESNSFSPRCSKTTDGAGTKNTKSETDSPGVRWPKLAKDCVSSRKSGETTSVTKPRLIQDGTSGEKNLRVANAKKLAKAAKAKTIAKIKNSNQSKLQNGAETSQLAQNSASCEDEKKCTAKAVWTPPTMPAGKTPPVGEKRSHLSVKKGTRSQDHTLVYPPSVSLHPIPVKAPPVVSPLQPLSVIGWRLLKNQCGECGRVLSSSAALESHVSLHKGRRPFSCMLCGKRFPDSKGLKRHGRVHRNGRIHICQTCGKGFVYRFCLTKHIQMVHSKIKPFVCQICDKGFFTKRDVENHIRLHTGEKPFHCNLCEKKFARRVELNVHLRWHNGEKRHWCPYCGKGFLDFNNLKRHKYIHTGEKPHSCPHCPKNFTQSGHLKKHVKNVHKIQ